MMKKSNNEAVSPVIGVILMVAITVILAAVIAAFVFGMAGNVQKTKIVSITMQRGAQVASGIWEITAINNGGTDAGSLTNLTFTGNNVFTTASCLGAPCEPSVALGCRTVVYVDSNPAQVLVVGTFADGVVQILLDQRI
jgi:flagellin-like protein